MTHMQVLVTLPLSLTIRANYHKGVNAMKLSKWAQGVNEYADELREFLTDEKLDVTLENMLNGASDWKQYSWGGSSLIYDDDIAERLATPSEIARRTNKDGSLKSMASPTEAWLDVQARALYQASHKVLQEVK